MQVWAGLDSGLRSLKQLLLVVQQEFGKGIDGIDGFQSDGYIFGPEEIWAKHNCQVGVCHLVSVTVSRDLCGKERDHCESHRIGQQLPSTLPKARADRHTEKMRTEKLARPYHYNRTKSTVR